jgi:beta-lactam-binding protein with PASTA domain
MFKNIVQFIKSKAFFKNLAIFIVLFSIICWIILRWLASYTNHNETVTVPDFTGIKLSQLDAFVADKHVRYRIIDSLYSPKAAKGIVVKQEPEPKEQVKDNRTIYLYVTSLMPPSILMPKLIDRSLRQATAMITNNGLRLGKLTYTEDECSNCILDQFVKGKHIAPGTFIPKGTVVDLVIGRGMGQQQQVEVPCVLGLSKADAAAKLKESGLVVGEISYDNDKDSLISKVFDQTPACEQSSVGSGTKVDLYLTTTKSKITKAADSKKDENFD